MEINIEIKIKRKDTVTDITPALITATWSGNKESVCRMLEFSVLSSPYDASAPKIEAGLMDMCELYEGGTRLFVGYIWRATRATTGNRTDYVAYDRGFYLKRNEASYKFSKKTPAQIAKAICKDFGIPTKSIADPDKKITRNFMGTTLYNIIQTAYTLASDGDGKQYQITFDGDGKLSVSRRGNTDALVAIGDDLMMATVTESAEKTITRVAIYDANGKLVKNEDNKKLKPVYGILQAALQQTSGDNKIKEAQQLLKENGLETKITVETIGGTYCRTGRAVTVKEPYTGLKGVYYIDADSHTWKNGIYTNKLTLNLKNIMHEVEAGGENYSTASKRAGTAATISLIGGGTLVTKTNPVIEAVLNYCRGALGSKYNQNRRWEEGYYDCSSLISRAFRAAGVMLSASTAAYLPTCRGMRIIAPTLPVTGKPDTSVLGKKNLQWLEKIQWSLIRPGDLIFYYGAKNFGDRPGSIGHVSIVETVNEKNGTGRIIHATPKTTHGVGRSGLQYDANHIVCICRWEG